MKTFETLVTQAAEKANLEYLKREEARKQAQENYPFGCEITALMRGTVITGVVIGTGVHKEQRVYDLDNGHFIYEWQIVSKK